MRQLYILKCALTQKLRQLLCPSSHTTFHWVPLSLPSPFLPCFPLSYPFFSLLFSCMGFVGVPWLKCSQTVIGSFVLALLPFSDFLFHFTFCFSFFSLSVYICCCMKVRQGNAGAALELMGLGSLCGTDSCRVRYGKQKVSQEKAK